MKGVSVIMPLNIVVCVKQVLETRMALHISESAVIQKEPWPVQVINPADRCALEEAIRLRDEAGGGNVTAVTLGNADSGAVLAHCLARGADNAIHVLADMSANLDSFSVARVFSKLIGQIKPDLVLCGNRTEDDGASEVGPVLAELLNLALVTNAVNLRITDNVLTAVRKLEKGYRQELEANLPALVTVETSICQPRYVTVRANRYRTKRLAQDIRQISITDPGLLSYGDNLRCVVGFTPPRPRPKKIARDAGASAADKMAALMGLGGAAPKKSAQSSTGGGPESLADEIIDFLKERSFLA